MIALVGCASYPKKLNFEEETSRPVEINNPYFSDGSKDYVYKADIQVFKNSFGGIFIVKKLGAAHHRIAFTTEMGNKILDFEFQGKTFKINQILPEIDKKVLINMLKHDFFALIHENPIRLNSYSKENSTMIESEFLGKKHYYLSTNGRLEKIIRTKNGKPQVIFLFSKINDNIADDIQIDHKKIKLRIHLKRL